MKPTRNPWILEKTRTSHERECPLSDIPYVLRTDGRRGCIWCGDELKSQHHLQRYCADPACPRSAYMWGYPQREMALQELLRRQDFKCLGCDLDWKTYLTGEDLTIDNPTALNRLRNLPRHQRPEVDHVVAIILGGASLGLDNHQALCRRCHLKKTKIDLQGPKRVKSAEEIQRRQDQKHALKIYDKLGPFLRDHYQHTQDPAADFLHNTTAYQEIFLGEILTIEELEALIRRRSRYPEPDNVPFKELSWARAALARRQK